MSQWKPNTTVAAIIERDGRYLMVEENTPEGRRYNQPAGHLENGETLLQATIREALEETGWQFTPAALVGIYMVGKPDSDITYLRFAFCGEAASPQNQPQLDPDIVATHWLTYDEIISLKRLHRSPVVMQCIDDYRNGQRHSLNLLHHIR